MENKKGFVHFGAIAVIVIVLGFVGYFSLTSINNNIDTRNKLDNKDHGIAIGHHSSEPDEPGYDECLNNPDNIISGIYPTYCLTETARYLGDYTHGEVQELGIATLFENTHYSYRFEFPSNWNLEEFEHPAGVPTVWISEPCDNPYWKGCPGVSFQTVAKIPSNNALKEYSDFVLSNSHRIISEEEILLNNNSAYYVKYVLPQSHGGYEPSIEIITAIGNKILKISLEDRFVNDFYEDVNDIPLANEEIFNQIISTFQFMEQMQSAETSVKEDEFID